MSGAGLNGCIQYDHIIYIYIYIHTYIHTYIQTYIHTYIHIILSNNMCKYLFGCRH